MTKIKKALVTGSSRGIGNAIARRLANDGYHVIIHCASNIEIAKKVATEINDNGGSAEYFSANLCDTDATKRLCEVAKDVDVLVLNASVQYRKKWEEITLSECYDQLNCNYVSSLMLIQSCAEHMKNNKWGRIVTIGSIQEVKPHPDMLVYSSSKGAQTNMMKSLSLQLAPFGITVNNVAPGVFATDRNTEVLKNEVYLKSVLDRIPLGFIAEPEDCAGIVSLLCSEDGRFITGQSIFVDGGNSVK